MTAMACVAPSSVVLQALGLPQGRWGRAEQLREQDRADFLAARQLTAWLASRVSGREWHASDIRQACDACAGTGHGRPSLPGVSVSWSHAAGVVASVAGSLGPVAVDIQPVEDEDLVREVLGEHAASSDPLREWVLRECLVKVGVRTLSEALRMSGSELAAVDPRSWRAWRDRDARVQAAVMVCGEAVERVEMVDLRIELA